MGLLRFCLALAVVSCHVPRLEVFSFHFIDGRFAVRAFFIISGFYMALILNEKYSLKKDYYGLFISNRILRLYPLYLLVFVVSLLLYMACSGHPTCTPGADYRIDQFNPYAYFVENLGYYSENPALMIFIIVSNFLMLGLDVAYFLPGTAVSVIGPAWTLSMEFYFYFMAPFLVRLKSLALAGLLLLSILSGPMLALFGLYHGYWTDRFFPSELVFFLLGIVSYRIYDKLKVIEVPKAVFAACWILIFVPTLAWPILRFLMNGLENPPLLGFYFAMLTAGLPVIFKFTKDNAWDRWIGEFSYPIYLLHFAAIYFMVHVAKVPVHDPYFGEKVVLLSFAVSLLLLHVFIYPVERWRASRILNHKM